MSEIEIFYLGMIIGGIIGGGIGVFVSAICVASSDNNNNHHKPA